MNTISCEENRICEMFAGGFSIEQISKTIHSERSRVQQISLKAVRGIVEGVLCNKAISDNKSNGAVGNV